jgi:hypothetical protein
LIATVPGLDRDRAAFPGEFDGITEEVDQNLPDLALVGNQPRHVGFYIALKDDVVFLNLRVQQADRAGDDTTDINFGFEQIFLARFDLGQVQEVIDESQQMLPGLVDIAGIFEILRASHGTQSLASHDLGKADDPDQRRA